MTFVQLDNVHNSVKIDSTITPQVKYIGICITLKQATH